MRYDFNKKTKLKLRLHNIMTLLGLECLSNNILPLPRDFFFTHACHKT